MNLVPIIFALTVIFLLLSFWVIKIRNSEKISLGYENSEKLTRAVRAHANFVDYTPYTLILLLIVDLAGFSLWWINTLGVIFIIGRISHAIGMIKPGHIKLVSCRVFGMQCTFAVIITTVILLCFKYLSQYFI